MIIPPTNIKPAVPAAQAASQATIAAKTVASNAASQLSAKPASSASSSSSSATTQKPAVVQSKPTTSQTAKTASKTTGAKNAPKKTVTAGNNNTAGAKKNTATMAASSAKVLVGKQAVDSLAAPLFSNATSIVQSTSKNASEAVNKVAQSLQQQFQKVNQTMNQSTQEMNKIFEENLNSTVQALNIFAKSAEEISKAYFSFAQNALENNIKATKSLFSCRNAQEAFELQNNIARTNLDSLISEGTKLSQLSFDAANKTLQPLQTQLNKTVDSFIKKAA